MIGNLVYDVGMNNGDDTAYYLTRRSRNQKDLRAHHERSEIRSY